MFYGWRCVGATLFTQSTQAGILIYSFSVIAYAIETSLAVPRASVMVASTCLSLVTSALAPFVGKLVDRVSVRRLMFCGCLAIATGFVLLSQVTAIWQVWLIFGLVLPFGNLLLGQMTSSALVTRWFRAHQGKALGISALGTSIGGMLLPLAFSNAVAGFSWRLGLAAVGTAAALVTALAIAALVRDRPEDLGLQPDGASPQSAAGSPPAPDLGLAEILAMPVFWLIAVPIGLKIAVYIGTLSNLVPLAVGRGIEATTAATLLSLMAFSTAAGKLAFGFIADRVSLRIVLASALAALLAGLLGLSVAPSFPVMAAACLVMGLASGGLLPVWGALVATYFGRASFGRALGLTNFVMVPLTASAAPLAGYLSGATGNYSLALTVFAAALGLAVLLALLLPSPMQSGPADG